MSGFFRFLAFLLLVAVAIGIGAAVYNAGVTAGLDEAARIAAASGEPLPVPAYGYGYGPYWHGPGGWGFFGIIFRIFGIFLVIGLARAAFGWGRWNGPRGPGGWDGGSGARYERMEELHRELHRREAGERRAAGRRHLIGRRTMPAMARILIVDDEPKIVRLVADYLEAGGLRRRRPPAAGTRR